MATTPGIWSKNKLTSKSWNRRSHREPAWPRFAPTLWMALWLSGHQASIMACILTKHSSVDTQRIMVPEGEINSFAKVMNTCWQQSFVNGIGVAIFTPTGMILSLFVFYFLRMYHMSHPDIIIAWALSPIMATELTMTTGDLVQLTDVQPSVPHYITLAYLKSDPFFCLGFGTSLSFYNMA